MLLDSNTHQYYHITTILLKHVIIKHCYYESVIQSEEIGAKANSARTTVKWKQMSSDSNEKQINKIWNFPLSEQKNVSTQNSFAATFFVIIVVSVCVCVCINAGP